MKGYLIKDREGNYLTKKLWWYPCDKVEDVYVHPIDSIDHIKKKLESSRDNMLPGGEWSEPVEKIPAIWTREKGVIIIGEPEPWL